MASARAKSKEIVVGFVTVIVGAVLLSPLADIIYGVTTGGNVSGATASIVGLVTLFFGLAVLASALDLI